MSITPVKTNNIKIDPHHIRKTLNGMIDIPEWLGNLFHGVGGILLIDDRHDLGRVIYYNRTTHYYHGKYSPDHPSALHHWMLGLWLVQLGSIINMLSELKNIATELLNDDEFLEGINANFNGETGNYVTLDEYKKELDEKYGNNDIITMMPKL